MSPNNNLMLKTLVFGLIGVLATSTLMGQTIDYSDTGNGNHLDKIQWLTWAGTDLEDGIHDGDSVNFSLPLGGNLEVVFSNVSIPYPVPDTTFGDGKVPHGYLPSDIYTWCGATLYTAYDLSGSTSEILFSNIDTFGVVGNGENGQQINFDVTFTARLNGQVIPADIIIGDPETTNPAFPEIITVSTNRGDWKLIENIRGTNYGLAGLNTNTISITDTEVGFGCSGGTNTGTNSSPLLMTEGLAGSSTTINYDIAYPNGDGHEGIIFGINLPFDQGDAPASYLVASHLQQMIPTSSGVPDLTNDSKLYLGAIKGDPDYHTNDPLFSAAADGDDNDDVDDEDGLNTSAFQRTCGSGSLEILSSNISLVNSTGATAELHAWIDFDQNGTFDGDEYASSNVLNGATSPQSDLSFSVPTGFVAGSRLLRLRLSTDNTLHSNTSWGVAIDGEVEDYELVISESSGCVEICNDGIDNDNDGFFDCDDCDCISEPSCPDNDADGVADYCDLDDDNDGIPDLDECHFNLLTGNPVPNGIQDNIYPEGYWDAEYFRGYFGIAGSTYANSTVDNDETNNSGTPVFLGEAFFGINSKVFADARNITENQSPTSVGVAPAGYVGTNWNPSNSNPFYQVHFNQKTTLPGTLVCTGWIDDIVEVFVNGTRVLFIGSCCGGLPQNTTYNVPFNGGDDLQIRYTNLGFVGSYNFSFTESYLCLDDVDNDGIPNGLDLDSDNDGIFDLDEAGHTEADANDDGIIDGANSLFGTNGLFDDLETVADNGILNYNISDSEATPDGTYDPYELDSDDDGCFDAREEDVIDGDSDGVAGIGVPTVNPSNGLIVGLTYTDPANNHWQDPLTVFCFPEVCNDSIDNDNDGFIDELCGDCSDCSTIGVFNGDLELNNSTETDNFITEVDGWLKTPLDDFEIWWSGFPVSGWVGAPFQAYSGRYSMELNANVESTSYQIVDACPGESYSVVYAHLARRLLTERVYFVVYDHDSNPTPGMGTEIARDTSTQHSTIETWLPNRTDFILPASYTGGPLRIEFQSTGGTPAVGNVIDAIDLTLTCNLVEICDNGYDDDFDGLTDCEDPDCITSPTINLSQNTACINETIVVSSSDIGVGTTYDWDFGTNANPLTATGTGPHNVSYTSCGSKTIALTVEKNGCSISVDSIVTIIDNTNPVWTLDPQDLIMECAPSANYTDSIALWLANFGNGTPTDNCNSFKVTHNYSGLTTNCGSTQSTNVTFVIADSCGNVANRNANIQILDRSIPVITPVPDLTVDCETVAAAPTPSIVDSCDASPSLTYQEVIVQHPDQNWSSTGACALLYEISDAVYNDQGTPSTTDDEMSFVLTVIGRNTSAGWSTSIAGHAVSGTYFSSQFTGVFLSGGPVVSFTIVDDGAPACTRSVTVDASGF